ncbi:MAG: ComEC family competence protein, partial [Alistipes sp.]|nr:ComEC family competence protein [Alistipes sp.]
MKLSCLLTRLDRMPVLKLLVPFAAGIALAGRYELPLWFLAGAFVCTGVVAMLFRSQSAAVGMLLTAGFAAAQLRTPSPAVPRGIETAYEITVEGFPADRGRYTSADASVAAWRDPADGHWHPTAARDRRFADSSPDLRPA